MVSLPFWNRTEHLAQYRRLVALYGEAPSLADKVAALARVLGDRVVPKAARRLAARQKKAAEDYTAVLLLLYDDFGRDLRAALAGTTDTGEKKRISRDYVAALIYWMETAAWHWLAVAWTMGKLSAWWGAEDRLGHLWMWDENRYYLNRPDGLAEALMVAIDVAIDEGRDPLWALSGLRWRVKMYGGAFSRTVQQGAIRRPPLAERRKAVHFFWPPKMWWVYPVLWPERPPLFEPPDEWEVPEAAAPDVRYEEREFLWMGMVDKNTCRGPDGCLPQIGLIHRGQDLLEIHPGNRLCLSNCRCYLVRVDDVGQVVSEEQEYELPWEEP